MPRVSSSQDRIDVARRGRDRMPRLHETAIELEVPFHDVDAVGVVWHGHYYKYMEIARTALLRSRALDSRDLLGLRFGMVMVESRCRHIAPLRYGDRARVTAWFRDVTHRICIDYEIRSVDRGTRVARGRTVLASVTPDGRLLLRTPAPMLDRLAGAEAR